MNFYVFVQIKTLEISSDPFYLLLIIHRLNV